MAMNGHVITVVGPVNNRSYFQFARKMDSILHRLEKDDITILSGIEDGTDYLTMVYALRRGLRHVQYAPDRYEGEAAIYRMHERMLRESTHAVIFKSGFNKHIWAATKVAKELHIPARIITYPENTHAEESKGGYRRLREIDVRSLSRYRKRRIDTPIPRWDDKR